MILTHALIMVYHLLMWIADRKFEYIYIRIYIYIEHINDLNTWYIYRFCGCLCYIYVHYFQNQLPVFVEGLSFNKHSILRYLERELRP